MLTKITIRNFKLFEEAEIPLGNGFLFVGPNNGGKTSALQALSLWHIGLQKWAEKYASKDQIPAQRPGVTINRLDLIPLPVVEVGFIWFNRKVRRGSNDNIRIDLIVEGISQGMEWKCGLEFDYSNPEAFFCRPLRINSEDNFTRMKVPSEAVATKLAFLPPMSGLATEEALIREGRINVLLGQGQTAEVLRNLCYRVYEAENREKWQSLVEHMDNLFGVQLDTPEFVPSRGTITMSYTDRNSNTKLDLASSGRGMQQVLLLLAYLYDSRADTVFLLDEPDAHLEILRQKEIYNLINEVAEKQDSQIIAASHSEALLQEAVPDQSAVAFLGSPHILGQNQQKNVIASLKEISFEYYYGAEQKGWILYLEGRTDLRILRAFAKKLQHRALPFLENPLVKYVNDIPQQARRHFSYLKEAKSNLQGFLLLDRKDNTPLNVMENFTEYMWKKREIENYLCNREAIISYISEGLDKGNLFDSSEISQREKKINAEINELEKAYKTLNKPEPFSDDIKASDDFLVPLFKNFAKAMQKPRTSVLQKKDFHKLVEYIPPEGIDNEVTEVLNAILEVAEKGSARSIS